MTEFFVAEVLWGFDARKGAHSDLRAGLLQR